MVVNKYLAGLLAILGTVAFAFQQAVADNVFSVNDAWELAGLFAGALVTIWVPLLKGAWAAGLKVAATVAIGVIGAVIGALASGTWDLTTWTAIIFAGINALLIQLGVSIRLDTAARGLADPTVSNAAVQATDSKAVQIAVAHDGFRGVG